MFEGVRKLPPAHWLTFSERDGLDVRRYWDLSYEPKLRGTEDELIEALEAELVAAVRLNTVSDVPVGAFLSGGLDSTLVTAIAARHRAGGAPVPTFSLGLPYRGHDEAPYARMVAERYGTRHHEWVTVPSPVEHLPDLVHHLDEPTDPLCVCLLPISGMASREVRVVLGGNGGNELFGGYDRYCGNLWAGWYAALLPGGLRRSLVGPLLGLLPDGAWYKSRGHQAKWLHQASFLAGGERYARMYGYPYFRPDLLEEVAGPELARADPGFDPYDAIREAYERAQAEHPVDRMLYADTQVRLPDHSCMNLDRISMAHGPRGPGARSWTTSGRVHPPRSPQRLKVGWRTMRHAQRRLCARHLPQALLEREKQAFSSGLPYLLGEEYRVLTDRLLRCSWLARDGVLRQEGIDGVLARHRAGREDHGHRLWQLIHLEAWYRQRICGESREAMAELIAHHAGDPAAAATQAT
jgi:asparagine synthase (glutamine-hydrolysing)